MKHGLFVFSVFFILAGLTFSATSLNDCTVISASGEYVLSNDVSGALYNATPYMGMACIKIMSNSVTLDCAGHRLTGPGPLSYDTFGVIIPYDYTNVTVRNCQINNYSYGIFTRGLYGKIQNNSVYDSNINGIHLAYVTGTSLSGNFVYGSGLYGYELIYSHNNFLDSNYVNNSAQDGIFIFQSNSNTLNHMYSSGNGMEGIYAYQTNNTVINNSIVQYNHNIGVYVSFGNNIRIHNTDASHNLNTGFYFYNITNLNLYNLTAIDEPTTEYVMNYVNVAEAVLITAGNATGDGIQIYNCHNMNFSRLVSKDNGLNGMLLRLSSGIRIESAEDDEPGLLSGNGGNGILAINVSDMRVSYAQFNGNGGNGFSGDYVDGLTVTNSVFSLNTQNGMHIPHNDNYTITLSRNRFTSNGADGIFVVGAYSVSDNESEYSDEVGSGMHIVDVSNVNLASVKAINNGEDGFNLANIRNITIADVNASNNLGNGFSCNTCTKQRITGSTFSFNSLDGFHNPHNSEAIRDGNMYSYNLRDGMYVSGSINVQIINSRQSFDHNGRNGLTLENTSGILVNNDTFYSNANAGVELIGADNTTISTSSITNNQYGLLFDSGITYAKTTITANTVENNTIADIHIGGLDSDGDGVPNDQDQCPYVYGKPEYNGCPAAIRCRVTANDVLTTGQPGQQPLQGAVCMAFDKANACVSARHPDSQKIVQECTAFSSCVTNAEGVCIAGVVTGNYFVAASDVLYPNQYPAHDMGYVELANSPKQARLTFMRTPDGKTSPGKSTKKSGSELWVYQPEYVTWDGTQEYYPFVFESDSNWTVDVCVDPPQGYQVADSGKCVQQIVAGEPKAILFKLVETGSMPDDVGVRMTLTDHKGKKQQVLDRVGTRLTEKLANKKGVAIDKNGVVTGKATKTEEALPLNLVLAGILVICLLAFVVDAYIRRRR